MKNNKIKIAIGCFGILVGMSTSSMAQGQNKQEKKPPTFSELLKEMDKNEDGKLSKAEVKGPLKEEFSTVDTDEDGFISEAEFKKAPKPKSKERIK
ncbi:MAG: EF-hand domain-containing protein [Aquaticitalea sp.]